MQNDFSLVVFPIFACSLIGLLWVRLKLPMNAACLSALVSNIGIPCLLLSSLDRPNLTARVLVHTFAAGAVALVCFAALGALFLRVLRLPMRQYLPSLMLPNTSNLGLPVALFAFGEQGLLYAVAFSALVQIGHFTIGVWLLSGQASWKSIAVSPTIWAVVAALFMTLNGLHLPAPLAASVKQLGNMAPPLMLLMLGASLANIRLAGLRRVAVLAVVRVAGGLGVELALALLLGLPSVAAGAFVVHCTMPVAVLSHLIAQQYDGPTEDIAGMILVSTGLALAGLPLMLASTKLVVG
ncbi:transporter [Burkholderia sp. MSMB617WGS]|uniref:AEC family transporter n=1 Tax=Burkholderia TaxID=32008 RepID=UPI000530EAC2|nr:MULTISPECIES: AEC family transporter [Burkholderia]AOK49937.1 transporter [Burkholderia sp. MSMB617WGS]KGS04655.1 membrane transport family protein [Burkholderia sp. ABCPW 111]KWZ47729.1 transporter [Burkholderia savannae]